MQVGRQFIFDTAKISIIKDRFAEISEISADGKEVLSYRILTQLTKPSIVINRKSFTLTLEILESLSAKVTKFELVITCKNEQEFKTKLKELKSFTLSGIFTA